MSTSAIRHSAAHKDAVKRNAARYFTKTLIEVDAEKNGGAIFLQHLVMAGWEAKAASYVKAGEPYKVEVLVPKSRPLCRDSSLFRIVSERVILKMPNKDKK